MRHMIVWLLVLLIAACNQKTDTFTVSGIISNAPSPKVTLEELSFNQPQSEVVDSVTLDEKGRYTLKGSRNQEGLYLLSINRQPTVIFINDGENIQISFDVQHFKEPDIKGSSATASLYQFLKEYARRDSILSVIYGQVEVLSDSAASVSENSITQLQQKGLSEMQKLNSYIKDFVKKSESPAAICFALDKAKLSISLSEMEILTAEAVARFPEHAGLTLFKNAITYQQAQERGASEYILLQKPAPDLTMKTPDGKPLSISSFKGKYLLVDFWASWCGPCRQENPNLVAAYQKYKSDKFEILGVSLDREADSWKNAIEKDKLTWPQMSDLAEWKSEAVKYYQFEGIPFNVLIDPSGKIVAHNLRGNSLEATLSKFLK